MSVNGAIVSFADLDRLNTALVRLHLTTGRTADSVLALKGGQLLYGNRNAKFGATFRGLYSLFREEMPDEGQIWAEARARGFRIGSIGAKAMQRAEERMGGFKSVLISTNEDGTGLSFVRVGTRKKPKRVHFRHGRKSFAVSGAGNSEVAGGLGRLASEKAVNLRAVSVFFELQLRDQGRGFMGAAWLHKRWRKFAKEGFVPAGTPGLAPGFGPSRQFGGTDRRLVNENPRSEIKLLGEAEMKGAGETGNVSLRISSRVPGTKAIGEGRRLFSQVINAVSADTETYLARKAEEAVVQSFK